MIADLAEIIRGHVFESDDVAEHMHQAAAQRAAEAVAKAIQPQFVRILRIATVNMPIEVAEQVTAEVFEKVLNTP